MSKRLSIDRAYRLRHRMYLRMGVPYAIVDIVHFSLTCNVCDDGEHVATIEQARREGWRNMQYEDGVGWNFIGTCPECHKDDEASRKERDDER